MTTAVRKANSFPVQAHCRRETGGAHRFAEESCGDVPALFVLRVAAASTSVDGHTRRFIENVGGGPELPAHVHTHLPGDALSPPPLGLDTCRRHDRRPNAVLVDKTSSARSVIRWCLTVFYGPRKPFRGKIQTFEQVTLSRLKVRRLRKLIFRQFQVCRLHILVHPIMVCRLWLLLFFFRQNFNGRTLVFTDSATKIQNSRT